MLRLLRSSVRKAAKKGTSCTFFSFEYFCLRKKLAGFLKRASCPPLSIPYTDAGKNCTSLYNSCPPKAIPCRNLQTQLPHYAAGALHYNAAGALHYNAAGVLHYNAAGALHYNAAGVLHYNAAGVLHYNAAVHCTFFRRRLLSSCGSSLF